VERLKLTTKIRKMELSTNEKNELLNTLKKRFDKNLAQHKNLEWSKLETKLERNPKKLWSLGEMENTGGTPDVVGYDEKTGEYIFYDCSAESPKVRRRLCYDGAALNSRKEHKPGNSAIDLASEMGIEIMTETQYRHLQTFGPFDTKTSSWIWTPPQIRALGGAIFCDFRYGNVFVYHNGAESYYAARGFRGVLKV
jgi:hypothetical protein